MYYVTLSDYPGDQEPPLEASLLAGHGARVDGQAGPSNARGLRAPVEADWEEHKEALIFRYVSQHETAESLREYMRGAGLQTSSVIFRSGRHHI